MVRADERAWGAREAGATGFEHQRAAEARRYAVAFATHERQVSEQLFRVAGLIETLWDLPSREKVATWADEHADASFLDALPAEPRDQLQKLSVAEGPLLETPDTLFDNVPDTLWQSPTEETSKRTTQAALSSSSLSESWSARSG